MLLFYTDRGSVGYISWEMSVYPYIIDATSIRYGNTSLLEKYRTLYG